MNFTTYNFLIDDDGNALYDADSDCDIKVRQYIEESKNGGIDDFNEVIDITYSVTKVKSGVIFSYFIKYR